MIGRANVLWWVAGVACGVAWMPLVMGFGLGLLFGYSPLSSLLIGSVFASHTLLGYPIVQRLGLVRNEAVTVTIGDRTLSTTLKAGMTNALDYAQATP